MFALFLIFKKIFFFCKSFWINANVNCKRVNVNKIVNLFSPEVLKLIMKLKDNALV